MVSRFQKKEGDIVDGTDIISSIHAAMSHQSGPGVTVDMDGGTSVEATTLVSAVRKASAGRSRG